MPIRTLIDNEEIGGRRLPRRGVLLGTAALLAGAAAVSRAVAEDAKQADFLFVQTAREMVGDGERLILKGVSPVTLFFSDRPERIAGNMSTAKFVPFWSTGKDSFLSDPPNADVTVVNGGELSQTVVVLSDPVLEGDTLTYRIKTLEGALPAAGSDVSIFIDVIGMPLTPVSYAGVARRSFRRAVVY
jgi:hypothetical protein